MRACVVYAGVYMVTVAEIIFFYGMRAPWGVRLWLAQAECGACIRKRKKLGCAWVYPNGVVGADVQELLILLMHACMCGWRRKVVAPRTLLRF